MTELTVVEHAGMVVRSGLGDMVAQHELYLETCQKLLNESDYATIGKTRYRKRTGWAKLRRAFDVSLRILTEEYVERGQVWGYVFTVEARLPNGRTETGDGACFSDEFQGNRITATHHNVRAKALTRAKNRATSDILGAGDVSAEEMLDEPEPVQHWAKDPRRRQKFWGWAHNDMGLTKEQVHLALDVDSIFDFDRSAQEAFAQIQNWVNEQVDETEAKAEGVAIADMAEDEQPEFTW